MTAPTKAKTWQFAVNQVIKWTTFDAVNQALMLALKNSLKGFTTNPWTVRGSSNSVAAAMDGVDRWATTANLVYGTNHSWIVLRQDGLNAGFEVCIDYRISGGGTIAVSPSAGFTGGAINARPTAADEYTCTFAGSLDAAWGVANVSAAFNHNLHVMQSTDGECTRVFVTVPSADNALTNFGNEPTTTLFACFEKLRNPVTGFTIPVVSMWAGATNGAQIPSFTNLTATSAGSETMRSRHNGTTMRMTMSWEYSYTLIQNLLFGPNTFASEYAMLPIGAYCPNTASRRGRHGEFYDMWAGPQFPSTSFVLPDATSLSFVKVGNLYLPWDGASAPIFS